MPFCVCNCVLVRVRNCKDSQNPTEMCQAIHISHCALHVFRHSLYFHSVVWANTFGNIHWTGWWNRDLINPVLNENATCPMCFLATTGGMSGIREFVRVNSRICKCKFTNI